MVGKGTGLLISTPELANWVGFYLMTTDICRPLLCTYLGQGKEDQLREVVTWLLLVEVFVTNIKIFAR